MFFFLQLCAVLSTPRSANPEAGRISISEDIAKGELDIQDTNGVRTSKCNPEERTRVAELVSKLSLQPSTPAGLINALCRQQMVLSAVLFDYKRIDSFEKIEIILRNLTSSKSIFGSSYVRISSFGHDDLSSFLFQHLARELGSAEAASGMASSASDPDAFISLFEGNDELKAPATTFVRIFRFFKADITSDSLLQFFELCNTFIINLEICASKGWFLGRAKSKYFDVKAYKTRMCIIEKLDNVIGVFREHLRDLRQSLDHIKSAMEFQEALSEYVIPTAEDQGMGDIPPVQGEPISEPAKTLTLESDEMVETVGDEEKVNPAVHRSESVSSTSTLVQEDVNPTFGRSESAETLVPENENLVESVEDESEMLGRANLRTSIKAMGICLEMLLEYVFELHSCSSLDVSTLSNVIYQHNALLAIVQVFDVDTSSSEFKERLIDCLKKYTASYILSKLSSKENLIKRIEDICNNNFND